MPVREDSYRDSIARQSPHLTPRELEMLQMAADGEDCQSTARLLGICAGTVKRARNFATVKLGADNTTQAVAMALRRGLIK
jgi:DNA-binding CsgD family transcriptional regulator